MSQYLHAVAVQATLAEARKRPAVWCEGVAVAVDEVAGGHGVERIKSGVVLRAQCVL